MDDTYTTKFSESAIRVSYNKMVSWNPVPLKHCIHMTQRYQNPPEFTADIAKRLSLIQQDVHVTQEVNRLVTKFTAKRRRGF